MGGVLALSGFSPWEQTGFSYQEKLSLIYYNTLGLGLTTGENTGNKGENNIFNNEIKASCRKIVLLRLPCLTAPPSPLPSDLSMMRYKCLEFCEACLVGGWWVPGSWSRCCQEARAINANGLVDLFAWGNLWFHLAMSGSTEGSLVERSRQSDCWVTESCVWCCSARASTVAEDPNDHPHYFVFKTLTPNMRHHLDRDTRDAAPVQDHKV